MSQKDKIVIICPNERYTKFWVDGLREKAPHFEIETYPDDTNREKTEFVMAFDPPKNVFDKYPNLKVVGSMGAGVQSILNNPSLPENVEVTKVVQTEHQQDIAEFVLALCLSHLKNLMIYTQNKTQQLWEPHKYKRAEETTVGIMGIGAIGQVIGKLLVQNYFKVTGWSSSEKDIENIQTFHGSNQKEAFLKTADILVCILPLTKETEGILNTKVFEKLPEGAYLINVGRGGQLVEQDLLEALEKGQLSGAALDVFQQEPLPENHPFWQEKNIMITPHVAGNTHTDLAAEDVLRNYKAMKTGNKLIHKVNRKKGY